MLRIIWLKFGILLVGTFCAQIKPLMAQHDTLNSALVTVYLTPDSMIVFKDSLWIPIADTVFLIPEGTYYKIKKNRYKKSSTFYDSVYYKTHKNKISKELYSLALTHRPDQQSAESGLHTVAQNQFENYEGKTIRSIRFRKVDILEGSVDDTLIIATSGFSKILDRTHINTHTWILKKYMLVKPGDEIIPAILADNERIIRDIPAIEDVNFLVVTDSLSPDLVDLIVITKDIFSIGATASVSSFDRFDARLWDNNSFGFANELGGKVMYDAAFKNPWGYELYSRYNNLLGTFIDGTISWFDAFDSRRFKFEFSKGFLTPQTKYGGGVNVGWIRDKYELSNNDTLINGIFETNYQDVWIGRAFLIGDKSSRKNMILSARYERTQYTNRPYVDSDSNLSFQNRNIYYGKLGYSKINFYKANMIRSYGISENIPYGFNAGFTVAYLESDFFERVYLGLSFGAGKYLDKFGYLVGNLIFGSFYNHQGSITQGLIESNIFYYTPLIKINRYKSRSFLYIRYREIITKDVERQLSFEEYLRNFDQANIGGISTLIFNYEFVLFSPWYFYGFRFAPYVYADIGLISTSRDVFAKSRMFSVIGGGFRIRNESLAFKTIILSFGYFPNANIGNADYFYNYYMGDEPLVPILNNDRPFILRRNLILPY